MQISSPRSCGGATYVMLLTLIAVISVVASNSASIGIAMTRRSAEQQLLAIGTEFQQALQSYAEVSMSAAVSSGDARGPRELEHLLRDPRLPGVRRHIRQIYADPLTGTTNWGVVRDASGSIVGVYSVAEGVPIKREGFNMPTVAFDNAENYQKWVFALPTLKGKP